MGGSGFEQGVEAAFAHYLFEHGMAAISIFVVVKVFVPLPDAITRSGAHHEVQPVETGVAVLLGDDFDDVAILQFCIQRDDAAIYLRPSAVVAHFCMDAIGKINRRRAPAEGNHIAIGRKSIDLFIKQVVFDPGKIFLGIFEFVLPI